jgi:hypothetical protein
MSLIWYEFFNEIIKVSSQQVDEEGVVMRWVSPRPAAE